MIWGEFLLSLDRLHTRYFEKFQDRVSEPLTLSARIFLFPQALEVDQSYDYEPTMTDGRIFLHPVTRFLLEGPISPNQYFHSNQRFLQDVFRLEQEALAQICATLKASPTDLEIRLSWLQDEWEELQQGDLGR
jgi:hypothetical protein